MSRRVYLYDRLKLFDGFTNIFSTKITQRYSYARWLDIGD